MPKGRSKYTWFGYSASWESRTERIWPSGCHDTRREQPFISTVALASYDQHAPTPYLQSWNFTVERELGFATAIEASYVGSKGTHLPTAANLNTPYRSAEFAPNFPVPFPGFGTINAWLFEVNSIYNAGTISFRR